MPILVFTEKIPEDSTTVLHRDIISAKFQLFSPIYSGVKANY